MIDVRAKILAPLKSGDVLPLNKYKTKTNFVVVDRKQNFIRFSVLAKNRQMLSNG